MASEMTKFSHLQIPLEDIVKATNNFTDGNIISWGRHGGFGNTYKGRLLRAGKLMDIIARRLNREFGLGEVEFWKEISTLSDLKHNNLVYVVGFCDEKEEKIIISSYEANGSLGKYLHDPKLTWMQRLTICIGVARALSYLHNDEGRSYGVIHRNISSDTILLDENWQAKLSGFEISLKQSAKRMDHVLVCDPFVTIGYMDPAILNTPGVTQKSDVYSYGIVLFEILCGRKAFIANDANRYLAPLAKFHYENNTLQKIIHPDLWEQMDPQSRGIFSKAAYSCLRKERAHRPNMKQVLDQLVNASNIQLHNGKNLEHLRKTLKIPNIPLSDIKLATNNFSHRGRIYFCDYFKLYRAELDLFDKESSSVEGKNIGEPSKRRTTVAIKRILPPYQRSFSRNIEMLTTCKHWNIVTLLGFCAEGSEMILILEHVSNGYLGTYIKDTNDMPILSWARRLKICLDVANGINYIHSGMEDGKMIINRDIRSDYIALDENWMAKIADFGLSIFLPPNQHDNALHLDAKSGTPRYMDPEYSKTGKLKRESDVYSFGVVLFEILFGGRANNKIYLDKGLPHMARQCYHEGKLNEMIDRNINEETGENNFLLNKGPSKDSLETFSKIAYQCLAETQDQRPTMAVVITELKKALTFHENHQNYLRMSLEDIKLATNNFDRCNWIGRGGSGHVFKGILPQSRGSKTIVAKLLDTSGGQREKQFWSELQILYEYKHENVIRLVGYCDEKDDKIIVYEHASNGSLDKYLKDNHLTWMKRLQICVDVATALDFLHGGAKKQETVIHRDIKAANILLDDDWKAKVADFGLSLITLMNKETDHVFIRACGTRGYVDPLYAKSGLLTIESDIYSFGVVLLEILCGRSIFEIEKHEGWFLPSFIKHMFEEGKQDEVVFEGIKEQIKRKPLEIFLSIAYQCLENDRDKRPTAKQVLTQLKKAMLFQMGGHNGDAMEWTQDCDKYFLEIIAKKIKRDSNDTLILEANDWIEIDEQMFMKFALRIGPERLKGKYNHLNFVHSKFGELINNIGVTWDPLTGKVSANDMLRNEFSKRDVIFETFKKKGCKIYPLLNIVFGGSTASDTFHNSATYAQEHRPEEDDPSRNDICDVGEREFAESSQKVEYEALLDALPQSKIAEENDFAEAEQYKSSSGEVTSPLVEEFSIAKCMSTLEAIPDVSTRSYTKAMTYFPDLNWRKMFLMMSDHRRKEWLKTLDN